MRIVDGIAYAEVGKEFLEVESIKALDDMMMIVLFNNGEERLFDATLLLEMPVFEVLKNNAVFTGCEVVDGIVTWLDGELDIAPETMYKNSFKYQHLQVM